MSSREDHFLAGKAAIENVNTIDERRSKIVRNIFFIAICRPIGGKWQSIRLFLTILISVRRL